MLGSHDLVTAARQTRRTKENSPRNATNKNAQQWEHAARNTLGMLAITSKRFFAVGVGG